MSKHPQYDIKTLAGFLSIPDDRLDDCLAEFKSAIRMSRGMFDLLHVAMQAVTGQEHEVTAYPDAAFPSFTWIDDGIKSGTMRISSDGDNIATFKYGPAEQNTDGSNHDH